MNKSVRVILFAAATVMAAFLLFFVISAQKAADEEVIPEAGTAANSGAPAKYLSVGGKEYPLKRRMETVLVIGTDNFNDNEAADSGIVSFYNFDQADFIAVLAFSEDEKSVTPFQINRDTMCSVPWLGVNGIVGGHSFEQIALAHTYGSGREDSCENTANAVSNLLFGTPIDHYIAFTMDAVPVLNDLVGGVTVTLEDDLLTLGEEHVKGAEVTLHGKDALRFVRQRDILIDDSNITRMKNQRMYLAGFTDAAREAAAKNPNLAVDAFKAVDGFICTDMTANTISELVDKLVSYSVAPVISPAGEVKLGAEFAEFYADEKDLQKCVKNAFCN